MPVASASVPSMSGGVPVSTIAGVRLEVLATATDPRGWLTELFRADVLEQASMGQARPVMAYVSMTLPGIARGPHEHREQTDFFAFVGPSDFEVTLWDNRVDSPTSGQRETLTLGASRPGTLIVPPGVVHAYRNVGSAEGWVLNFPNRLYRGAGRTEPVDEIRYENDPDSRFRLEERI